MPLSPKEKNEAINLNQEILKNAKKIESLQLNRHKIITQIMHLKHLIIKKQWD